MRLTDLYLNSSHHRAKNWKLFRSDDNSAYAYNGEDESAHEVQLQNSRFLIRRLSERQLLQNCGYDLEQGRVEPAAVTDSVS